MVVKLFENPKVPFQTELLRGMMAGRQIIVKGNICPFADVEVVIFTFSAGEHIMDEVLFSMIFDFLDNTIYLNSYMDYQWGESEDILEMPFLPGNSFEMELDTNREEFIVTVKGKEFCTFKHRQNPALIKTFEISGDVELTAVEVWDDLNIQNRIPDILPECPLIPKAEI